MSDCEKQPLLQPPAVVRHARSDTGGSATVGVKPPRRRQLTDRGRLKSIERMTSYQKSLHREHQHKRDDMETAAQEAWRRTTPFCTLSARRRVTGLKHYYTRQIDLLDHYIEDSIVVDDGAEGDKATANLDAKAKQQRRMDSILAQVTLWLNVALLIAKVAAAVLSQSLSIVSTVIDSGVDITSGLVIYLTNRAIEKHNPYEYPRGRSKLEPLAVVIVSIIMGAANLVMIIQSGQAVLAGTVDPNVDLDTIIILSVGTAIKMVLMVLCYRQKSPGGMVLAMDQRNDVITNLVALACGLIGTHLWVYADPIGAILVCSYISISWFFTAAGEIPILTGHAASGDIMTRVMNVVVDHDPRILCLDYLICYHYGTNILVELHVVLERSMSVAEAHDLTEPLQIKLEKLPYVERAFLHTDYKLDFGDKVKK